MGKVVFGTFVKASAENLTSSGYYVLWDAGGSWHRVGVCCKYGSHFVDLLTWKVIDGRISREMRDERDW